MVQSAENAMENQGIKHQGRSTDYTLLINRLEKAILHDQEMEKAVRTLNTPRLWQQLDPDLMIQWAGLCQVAGEVKTALSVYDHLTREEPENEKGWAAYLDLLVLLDDRGRLVKETARAERFLGRERVSPWVDKISSNGSAANDVGDLDGAAPPFEEMIWKREAMGRFMGLFSGREDVFARQWVDRREGKSGYVPVRQAMCLQDVEDHLAGRKTLGIYLLRSDARVRCGVIDVDMVSRYRTGKVSAEDRRTLQREKDYLLSRMREMTGELGVRPVLEFSGNKGFHFWFLFEAPVPAGKVRELLKGIAGPLNHDLKAFDLEVFPKQDRLSGKGLGNLVKLPLGIHRLSGKASFFPACAKRDMASQLHYLEGVVPIKEDTLAHAATVSDNQTEVVIHPRMQKTAEAYPELYRLEQQCPPLGQVLASCRQGRTCTSREEKVLYQTIGFLGRARTLLHYLMAFDPEYNPHLVDFKLSKVRGTPLGCRRIHSLLGFTGDFCEFEPDGTGYLHPLIHLPQWKKMAEKKTDKSERVENLQGALENMKTAIIQVQRFL